MKKINSKIKERTTRVINLWVQKKTPKQIAIEIYGLDDKKYVKRIYRDLNTEINITDDNLREWGKQLRVELLKKLGVAEERIWQLLDEKQVKHKDKINAVKTIKEIVKEIREIAQTSGFMPKVAEQIEVKTSVKGLWDIAREIADEHKRAEDSSRAADSESSDMGEETIQKRQGEAAPTD